jgi:hypothetical protein
MSEDGANAGLDFQDCQTPKARSIIEWKKEEVRLALRYRVKTAAR